MAISYPLTDLLADPRWRCSRFEPIFSQTVGEDTAGSLPTGVLGVDRWSASFDIGPLKAIEFDAMKARLFSLRGSMFSFLGYDVTRCKPIAYTGGASPPAKYTADIVQVESNANLIDIDNMATGFQVKTGDYLSFIAADGSYRFHQVMEDRGSGSSGSIGNLEVRPAIQLGWAADDVVDFENPRCLMKVVPGTLQMPRSPSGFGTISFDAIQVFRP